MDENAAELQEDFIREMFGCSYIPLTAENQKETFQFLVEKALGEDCDYSVVRNIHDMIGMKLEETKDDPEPLEFGKQDVRRLLEESGVPEERLEDFEREYDERAGEKTSFLAANIINTRQFQLETPEVTVKVKPEAADLVETRMIDGRQCLVIAVNEHLEVNGININFNMEKPE